MNREQMVDWIDVVFQQIAKKESMKNNLEKLIALGKFDYVNENITLSNFPPQEVRGAVEIFRFDKVMTTDEVLKEIDTKGYEPAHLYELLEYAKKGWDRENFVVAIGSVWRDPSGRRSCAYLGRRGSGRGLSLDWFVGGWRGICRFAGVKKLSETKTSEALPSELIINGETYRKA